MLINTDKLARIQLGCAGNFTSPKPNEKKQSAPYQAITIFFKISSLNFLKEKLSQQHSRRHFFSFFRSTQFLNQSKREFKRSSRPSTGYEVSISYHFRFTVFITLITTQSNIIQNTKNKSKTKLKKKCQFKHKT